MPAAWRWASRSLVAPAIAALLRPYCGPIAFCGLIAALLRPYCGLFSEGAVCCGACCGTDRCQRPRVRRRSLVNSRLLRHREHYCAALLRRLLRRIIAPHYCGLLAVAGREPPVAAAVAAAVAAVAFSVTVTQQPAVAAVASPLFPVAAPLVAVVAACCGRCGPTAVAPGQPRYCGPHRGCGLIASAALRSCCVRCTDSLVKH